MKFYAALFVAGLWASTFSPLANSKMSTGFLGGWGPSAARADTLADIKARKEILIGLDPGFIPFEMKKPNGEWVGFDIDMMNAFAQELGVKTKMIDTKWEGIIPSLQAKKFDVIVSGMTITEERKKVILFSDGYYKAGLSVLVAAKNIGKVKAVADLDAPQYQVATKLGTTGDIYATKNLKKAQLRKLDSESDASTSVLLGKVDAFIYDKPYLSLFAQKNKGKVEMLSQTFTDEDFGLAARRADKELVAAFNAFLKKWKSSGAYDKAIQTHFVDMPWLKEFPELK